MKTTTPAPEGATPPILGHVARAHRQRARVTLRKLSAMTGLTHVDIGRLERGLWSPSARELARIFTSIADEQDASMGDDLDTRISSRGHAPEGTSFLRVFRLMPRYLRGSIVASMRDLQREREAGS